MCKRYGRRVAEIGVAVLYYVLPVVHCDWSDAVWIPDKRRRFWGIAAGLYYQVVLWSLSTIGWFVTRPGGVPNRFWLVLSTATFLGFFLFVANPLVKMNGYWLLVNWIEVPRLRERRWRPSAHGRPCAGRARCSPRRSGADSSSMASLSSATRRCTWRSSPITCGTG